MTKKNTAKTLLFANIICSTLTLFVIITLAISIASSDSLLIIPILMLASLILFILGLIKAIKYRNLKLGILAGLLVIRWIILFLIVATMFCLNSPRCPEQNRIMQLIIFIAESILIAISLFCGLSIKDN